MQLNSLNNSFKLYGRLKIPIFLYITKQLHSSLFKNKCNDQLSISNLFCKIPNKIYSRSKLKLRSRQQTIKAQDGMVESAAHFPKVKTQWPPLILGESEGKSNEAVAARKFTQALAGNWPSAPAAAFLPVELKDRTARKIARKERERERESERERERKSEREKERKLDGFICLESGSSRRA